MLLWLSSALTFTKHKHWYLNATNTYIFAVWIGLYVREFTPPPKVYRVQETFHLGYLKFLVRRRVYSVLFTQLFSAFGGLAFASTLMRIVNPQKPVKVYITKKLKSMGLFSIRYLWEILKHMPSLLEGKYPCKYILLHDLIFQRGIEGHQVVRRFVSLRCFQNQVRIDIFLFQISIQIFSSPEKQKALKHDFRFVSYGSFPCWFCLFILL